ncbi:MAG TPA: hypothetical protein VFW86_00025 [Candidatus Limnocylindrales bacterium]|nr:hypothetical protein [Candidatus Limnocylindrales bacterium]
MTNPRQPRYENAGTLDRPFDDDHPSSHPLIQGDAACTIPWQADDYQAVALYIDPALDERMPAICQTVSGLCGQHADIDTLIGAIKVFCSDEELSPTFYEQPDEALSPGLLAVAFTLG